MRVSFLLVIKIGVIMFGMSSEERSGASIVAGTAIGASMLSLPFISGVGGFYPACLMI